MTFLTHGLPALEQSPPQQLSPRIAILLGNAKKAAAAGDLKSAELYWRMAQAQSPDISKPQWLNNPALLSPRQIATQTVKPPPAPEPLYESVTVTILQYLALGSLLLVLVWQVFAFYRDIKLVKRR